MKKFYFLTFAMIVFISCTQNDIERNEARQLLDEIVSNEELDFPLEIKEYIELLPKDILKSRLNVWRLSNSLGPNVLISIPLDGSKYIDHFEFDVLGNFQSGQYNSRRANILHRKLPLKDIRFNVDLLNDESILEKDSISSTYYILVHRDAEEIKGSKILSKYTGSVLDKEIGNLVNRISYIERLNFTVFASGHKYFPSNSDVDSVKNIDGYLINSSELSWKPNKSWN